jgi:iron uptake system component EfeO
VQPVSDYKIYVTDEIDTLAQETQKFTDAIKKGDLATAKALRTDPRALRVDRADCRTVQ